MTAFRPPHGLVMLDTLARPDTREDGGKLVRLAECTTECLESRMHGRNIYALYGWFTRLAWGDVNVRQPIIDDPIPLATH